MKYKGNRTSNYYRIIETLPSFEATEIRTVAQNALSHYLIITFSH